MVDKRARQFVIKKVNAPETEGDWRNDDTFSFQFPLDRERDFENAVDFIDRHTAICDITTSVFMGTHFQVDVEWRFKK